MFTIINLYGHIKTAEQLTSNTLIGTLAIDGWAVTFGTARRGLGGLLLAVPNVTAHPSTVSTNLHIVRCGSIIASAL